MSTRSNRAQKAEAADEIKQPAVRLVSVADIFRQMDALRQSLPKSKDKTSLKDLINQGRRC